MRNTLHKRYQINSSKPVHASSHGFKNQKVPNDFTNNFQAKKDSSYSDKDQQQISNDPRRSSNLPISKIGNSVAVSKHMATVQQKRKTLQRYRYINQLARLQYEDKLDQVYTKFTRLSKATAIKKILAKNQIAEFIDQQEDQNVGYDELLEFKFGKEKPQSYHYQKDEINQYVFCQLCDTAHNDHPQAHSVICQRKRKEQPELYSPYSQNYHKESLYRIKLVVQKIKSAQYQQLNKYLLQMQKISGQSTTMLSQKKKRICEGVKELKNNFTNDIIFTKIIAKVHYLIQKV